MERLILESSKALIVKKPFESERTSALTGKPFEFVKGQHLTVESEVAEGLIVSFREVDGQRSEGWMYENVFLSMSEVGQFCLFL
jgi:hypothetical protein